MINIPIEISDDCKAQLLAVTTHPNDVFSEIVAASGMSKSADFIGADLAEVDFTGSDLRGFNFKNADLSRSTGVNFLIDETTILDGANVTSSVLKFEKERREFLLDDDHRALYNRLKSEYWTNGAVWVGQNLKRSSKNFGVSAKIAKFLYAGVNDQTYKNQILYGIKNTFETKQEYKEFLVDQLRDPHITTRSLRGIIDILGRIFSRQPDVAQILMFYLRHEDKEIRRLCIPAVMQPNFFRRNRIPVVQGVVTEVNSELRRTYTGYFGRLIGKDAERLMYITDQKRSHDFIEVIDDRCFERMVRAALMHEKISTKIDYAFKGDNSFAATVKYEDVIQNADRFHSCIESLKSIGLPLRSTYSMDNFARYAPMPTAHMDASPTEESE